MNDAPKNAHVQDENDSMLNYLVLLESPDYDYYAKNKEISPQDKEKLLSLFLNEYAEKMNAIYSEFVTKLSVVRSEEDNQIAQKILKGNKNAED